MRQVFIPTFGCSLALTACAAWAQPGASPAAVAPLVLAQPQGATAPPETITLQDALQRARQNDAQFQTAVADAQSAQEDRVQARAGLRYEESPIVFGLLESADGGLRS